MPYATDREIVELAANLLELLANGKSPEEICSKSKAAASLQMRALATRLRIVRLAPSVLDVALSRGPKP